MKWAVYYITFGSSPTRVIVDADTKEDAIEKVRGRITAKGFEAYASRW